MQAVVFCGWLLQCQLHVCSSSMLRACALPKFKAGCNRIIGSAVAQMQKPHVLAWRA